MAALIAALALVGTGTPARALADSLRMELMKLRPAILSAGFGGPPKRKAHAGCSLRPSPRASASDHCSPRGARARSFKGTTKHEWPHHTGV
jgi:hypothetical protein